MYRLHASAQSFVAPSGRRFPGPMLSAFRTSLLWFAMDAGENRPPHSHCVCSREMSLLREARRLGFDAPSWSRVRLGTRGCDGPVAGRPAPSRARAWRACRAPLILSTILALSAPLTAMVRWGAGDTTVPSPVPTVSAALDNSCSVMGPGAGAGMVAPEVPLLPSGSGPGPVGAGTTGGATVGAAVDTAVANSGG